MFTCLDVEVVGGKDQIGRSGELPSRWDEVVMERSDRVPLFLVPDICFRVFNYGKVKRTFVSQLLRTSAKVLLWQVNRTFLTTRSEH